MSTLSAESLGNIPLFRGLAAEELVRIGALLHRRSVRAGTNFMSLGEPGEAVYLLLTGTVKVSVEQADGSEYILTLMGPGEILGEIAVLEGVGHSASVLTLEPTELLWMDGRSFLQCLRTVPDMTLNLVRIMSRRLRLVSAQAQALAGLDVPARVARQILAFVQAYGEGQPNGDVVIPLRLTQSELAGLVGASRVQVNRALSYYQQQGYLAIAPNHHLTVHNRDALARRCS